MGGSSWEMPRDGGGPEQDARSEHGLDAGLWALTRSKRWGYPFTRRPRGWCRSARCAAAKAGLGGRHRSRLGRQRRVERPPSCMFCTAGMTQPVVYSCWASSLRAISSSPCSLSSRRYGVWSASAHPCGQQASTAASSVEITWPRRPAPRGSAPRPRRIHVRALGRAARVHHTLFARWVMTFRRKEMPRRYRDLDRSSRAGAHCPGQASAHKGRQGDRRFHDVSPRGGVPGAGPDGALTNVPSRRARPPPRQSGATRY